MASIWALLVLAGFVALVAAVLCDFLLVPRGRKVPEFVVSHYRLAAVLLGLALIVHPGALTLYAPTLLACLFGWYPARDRLRRR